MSNNVITRTFATLTETFPIRIAELDGQPWFIAVDVCHALGFNLSAGAAPHMKKVANDERRVLKASDLPKSVLGSAPSITVVSESGLYKLIMRSDKPEARRFQDWVTRDVLPAIRKDGAYIMGEEKVATGEMDEDAFVLKAIEILQRKIDRLKAENDAMSQELNILTVDEYRALTHRYFTHSQKVKLGQAAARILRAQGQEPQRQERTVRFHGEERTVRVNLYPRAALEQAERELAA
ncbi:BRO family protein [Halopseudomonas aestusnigri]|uniref:BRO-N domain-containing protein n=1 Tax=Halopseudomonas aestusnigri TaxID=857252 RepID=UPI0025523271|nr:BRO family protein [Halopseudomonas aestusnigri]MDL2200635.1 BRO family protein [Halopseudomonas aestusnigri]